eukprot:GHVT01100281.1.p3 GENE.GHVT01100281.1~~GHVT01100281.1.p3  ORF type:complete len:101 (+),score=8.38 GHVT01100281.1:1502-1804(+)
MSFLIMDHIYSNGVTAFTTTHRPSSTVYYFEPTVQRVLLLRRGLDAVGKFVLIHFASSSRSTGRWSIAEGLVGLLLAAPHTLVESTDARQPELRRLPIDS